MKKTRCLAQFLLSLSICLMCGFVCAKPALEEYGKLPSVSAMRLSPSGDLIAFLKKKGDKDIVIVFSLKQGKMLTGADLDDLTPSNLYFINDKQLVIKASKIRKVMGYKGEIDLSTAYVLDVDSGDIDQLLIPGRGIYKGQSGLGDIVGLTKNKKEALMPAFKAKSDRDLSPSYALVRAKIGSRIAPTAVEWGSPETYDYFANESGKVVAEVRYSDKKDLHQIFSKVSGEWKEIYSKNTDIPYIRAVGLTPDQKHLVIKDTSTEYDRLVLRTMSLKDGKVSETIFSREDADIEDVFRTINRTVLGVSYSGLNPSYAFFDKKIEARVNKLLASLKDQTIWIHDWNKDWSKLIVKIEGSMSSGEFFLA